MTENKIWKIHPPSPLVSRLSNNSDLTPVQAQLLINRGIIDHKDAMSFLQPRLGGIDDPHLLKNMREAVNIIIASMEKRENITIYGDYDADGLTATALLLSFFDSLDIALPVRYHIPSRFKEGYGLDKTAIKQIAEYGPGLIITVDCGSSDSEEIKFAKTLNIKVVVTDHHQVPPEFDPDFTIINPHQPGCSFPFKNISGVGVAFYLAIGLRRALREKGWFKKKSEPDLKQYLDLVAIGTVADRVPLLGQNRILVKSGLEVISNTCRPGIKALMEVADLQKSSMTTEDLAFRLAPRLNAPGRMGDPGNGLRLLMVQEKNAARNLALTLDSSNSYRQSVEKEIFDQIENMFLLDDSIVDKRIIILGAPDWHRGVLGIVASRLVNKYNRPALVFNIHNGLATGSGRSIDGFDLFKILSSLEHHFLKLGGHAYATGFTLKTENILNLGQDLEDIARTILTDKTMTPVIEVDAEMDLTDISPEIMDQISALAPFGEKNNEPIFMVRNTKVLSPRIIGDRHLKIQVNKNGTSFDAIGFNLSEKGISMDGPLDILFTPEYNYWKGTKNIQLRIVDIRSGIE